jgi:hypothetical protein
MSEPLRLLDSLLAVVECVNAHGEVYVRHSRGPAADAERVSRDFEAGLDLPGLSVTHLTPEPWWSRPVEDWVARRLCKYDELTNQEGRFPWVLTGRVVGAGPDHEPLVVDVRPLGKVGGQALKEARSIYQTRFDVEQDSRG